MRRRFQLCIVGPFCVLLGSTVGLAADPPAADPGVWSPVQYDSIQGSATWIGSALGIAFDNFLIDNQSGEHDLVERKLLGASLPLKLEAATAVTELKADFRGAFLRDGEASGMLIVLIGGEQTVLRFPNDEVTDGGGDFILSMKTTERFPNGSAIPVTVLLITQKAKIEDSVMLTVDSLDVAAGTE